MINWIKFGKRQPEEEGDYLCYFKEPPGWHSFIDDFFILQWSIEDSCFGDMEDNSEHDDSRIKYPDYWAKITPPYWAEITPPLDRRSGISSLYRDPKTIKELQDLLAKDTPMPEKLLCKDCKWIATGLLFDPLYPKCDNPKAPHSLVTGDANHRCESLRGDLTGPRYREEMTAGERQRFIEVNPCGPEGRWFEAKEGSIKTRPDVTLGLTAAERRKGRVIARPNLHHF